MFFLSDLRNGDPYSVDEVRDGVPEGSVGIKWAPWYRSVVRAM
ncbi:unannotated protein [freshwater metagenome]|uniref:Unannotated protein n=1 Tax=freshwater metagenome TaxID=449393 RepID=A0A6J7FMZ7_9ZZZZ